MSHYKQTIIFSEKTISTISTAEIMNFVECHILKPNYNFQKFESFILENVKPITTLPDCVSIKPITTLPHCVCIKPITQLSDRHPAKPITDMTEENK